MHIMSTRKRPVQRPASDTAAPPLLPEPPPIAEEAAVPAALPDVPPPAPSNVQSLDPALGSEQVAALVSSLAHVGLPAGLFVDGRVEPKVAARVVVDHARVLGVDPADAGRDIGHSLRLLGLVDDATAAQLASAVSSVVAEDSLLADGPSAPPPADDASKDG